MELYTYLWKSTVIISIFYGFYKLLLQKETYFQPNRYFLLLGIILSFTIPFMIIPKYVYTEAIQAFVVNSTADNSTLVSESLTNWLTILTIGYLIITTGLFIKFTIQLISIGLLIYKSNYYKIDRYYFAETNSQTSPFSFFNFIVYNPEQFEHDELEQVLAHEKIHVNQMHSIDTILSNLLGIILWFNPFIWLYKKDIEQNLEFIADEYAQKKSKSQQSYQKLLLKTSIPNYQMALANNFYNSLLKKRIIMLHKKRSNRKSQWKLALIIPLLLTFVFAFNTKTIAQQKKDGKKIIEKKVEIFAMRINKESTKSDLDDIVKTFSEKGLTVKFNGIKRNDDNKITAIKIDAKAKNGKASAAYASDNDNGINPVQISFDTENNNLSIGSSNNHSTHEYSFSDKGHKKIIKRKGKGNSFVFFTDESDGVHEINIDENDEKEIKKEVIKIRSKSGNEDEFMFTSSNGDEEPLFIILDGKQITKKEMEELDPDTIESVSVWKGEKAIKKHGKKAKNGAVVITTKKK